MNDSLESILLDVSQSPLIDNGKLKQAYRLVINCLHRALNIQRAGIWFTNENYSEISCQLLIDTYHNSEVETLIISASDHPRYLEALKMQRAIIADDAHTHQATIEFSEDYLTPLGINSMLDIPIRHRGKVIGIICCEHIGPPIKWSEEQTIFAGCMADLIGRVINAHAFRESERKLKYMNDKLEETIKERTEQLVEAEKMAALGSLVAGVAHEVNTPLGIGITASSSLTDAIEALENAMNTGRLSEDIFFEFLENSRQLLPLLNDNLHRAAELIQTFKNTAVDHEDQSYHIFDLNESVRYLLLSLQPVTKKHNVDVKLSLLKKLSLCSYPSAWSQIISNMVINSCQHAFEHTEKPEITLMLGKKAECVLIDYYDNGCGVAPENINDLVLPFYTTKRNKGGTGLGLSIIYNLVTEQLNGTFKISSTLNEGLRIQIECPMTFLSS